jgi:hypothetical protein
MSVIRWRQSLGDIDSLGQNMISKSGMQGSSLDQIDPGDSQNFLQFVLNPEEMKQADGTVELYQQVHVTSCG